MIILTNYLKQVLRILKFDSEVFKINPMYAYYSRLIMGTILQLLEFYSLTDLAEQTMKNTVRSLHVSKSFGHYL